MCVLKMARESIVDAVETLISYEDGQERLTVFKAKVTSYKNLYHKGSSFFKLLGDDIIACDSRTKLSQ